jgi:hypothetical protein
MKFLQKILFIVMIGVFTRNVDVNGMIPGGGGGAPPPVLDLPGGVNGTPGLQGPRQNRMVNGVNASCYHIVVPNTPADIALNGGVNNAARVAAMAADGNIYFPRNGVQPTTPEAVQYSCANIDNRENSPITTWYMQMFGVIPVVPAAPGGGGPVFVQAGWNNAAPPVAQQIISFHASINNSIVSDPDHCIRVQRDNLFIQNFKRLASTSVGRVLLYRILIEIRRHNPGGNVGCLENGINPAHLLAYRNSSRTLEIQWGSRFLYGYTYISMFNFIPSHSVIGKEDNGYYHIVKHMPPIHVFIFHEMGHWYHLLRDPNRYAEESNCYAMGRRLDGTATHAVIGAIPGATAATAANISQHYWAGLLGVDPNLAISEEIWKNPTSCNLTAGGTTTVDRVPFEEMRNILGVPIPIGAIPPVANTHNGDDLCENLYRTCVGIPLRYGYFTPITLSPTCYEDSRVIEKVIDSCASQSCYYKCIPIASGNVDFDWNGGRAGLGNFRIF